MKASRDEASFRRAHSKTAGGGRLEAKERRSRQSRKTAPKIGPKIAFVAPLLPAQPTQARRWFLRSPPPLFKPQTVFCPHAEEKTSLLFFEISPHQLQWQKDL